MSFRNPRLRVLVVAAAILLPAISASAAPLGGPARARDDRGAFTVLFDGLRSLVRGLLDQHGSHSSVMKEGMMIDPHGGTTTPGAATDEGTSIDPHG
jgi:hypothetical protein